MNSNLFAGNQPKAADTANEAGGKAYSLNPEEALAHLACTGCFNGSYYSSDEDQLNAVVSLAGLVKDDTFLCKLAIYSRESAFMKDMPAALLCILSKRNPELFKRAFTRVAANSRVVRTFVQMIRSGLFGRKCISGCIRRVMREWFNYTDPTVLINASIGNNPSIRDVLRLVRPKPIDNMRRALFGFLAETPQEKWAPATEKDLPWDAKILIDFRQPRSDEWQSGILESLPGKLRWDLFASHAKGKEVWRAISKKMGHQALRMNLNTLLRHDLFDSPDAIDYYAGKLSNHEEVRKWKQFPYQYFTAFKNISDEMPQKIKFALQEATEVACENVPVFKLPVVIGLDVSGSMKCSVTGGRGVPTKTKCVDVAALFAAAITRKNPESIVIPFDTKAYKADFDPRDTITTIANNLSKYGGGGTDCSLPLKAMNMGFKPGKYSGIVIISDNESWFSNNRGGFLYGGTVRDTETASEWNKFKRHQKALGNQAKLACINIQPYTTVQAPNDKDTINLSGFSDAMFNIIANFFNGDSASFLKEIDAVDW